MKENKSTLDEAQFQGLEKEAANSADRMIYNSLISFLFVTMFRSSTDQQKQDILHLMQAVKADVIAVHKAKAEAEYALTKEQREVLSDSLYNIVGNSFKVLDVEFANFEKEQKEKRT